MDFTLDSAHGGNILEDWVDSGARMVSENAKLILAILVVMAVLIVYFGWWRLCACVPKQGFMPTQTMWAQASDQVGTGNRWSPYEHAAGAPDAAPMAAAGAQATYQQAAVGGATGQLTGGAGAATVPGSLAYQVLNSPDFACSTRVPVTDDAWSWMSGVASSESFRKIKDGMTARPATSSDLSKILAGH